MAVIHDNQFSLVTEFVIPGAIKYSNDYILTHADVLPGGVSVMYRNRVWDTVAGGYVYWNTVFQDNGGVLYPGPGVFGVNTSEYRVETSFCVTVGL